MTDFNALVSAVLQQESGGQDYNPDGSLVTSPAGAQGAMQVMPSTNANPGYGVAPAQDDTPEERDRVGKDYLSAMLKKYSGDEGLALAAYNAGPGKVDAALQQYGNDPQKVYDALPKETQHYVPKVLDNAKTQEIAQSGDALDQLGWGQDAGNAQAPPQPAANSNTSPDVSAAPAGDALDEMGYAKPKGLWDTVKDMGSSFASGDLQGLTMGAGDELTAGLSGDYDKNIGPIRTEMDQQYNDHPIAYDAGIGLGGIGNLLGLKGALNYIAPELSASGAAFSKAHPYIAASGVGAGVGGVSGYASGQDGTENRAEGAASSGALGAILGPLAHAGMANIVEPVLSSGGSALSALASKLGITSSDDAAKYSQGAVKKVSGRLGKDYSDPDKMAQMIKDYLSNKDTGLGESAGKNTQGLALGAAQYPSGKVPTENYLEGKASEVPKNLKSIASVISPDTDYYGTLDNITQKGRAMASPLYDEAYKTKINSNDVDDILNTPAGKQALGMASNKILNDRDLVKTTSPAQRNQIFDEAKALGLRMIGDPTPTSPPLTQYSLRTMDYVKRSFDDMIQTAKNSGNRDDARIITGLKTDLVNRLDTASPAYAQARGVSGDYLSNGEAMDNGRNYTSMDADTVKQTYNNLGPIQKQSFKSGVVRDINDKINNNPDKPQLYKSVFGVPNSEQRARIQNVLSPDEFQNLSDKVQAQQDFYDYRKQFGNSTTTNKGKEASVFDDGLTDLAYSAATKGPVKTAINAAMNFVKRSVSGLGDAQAGQVAQMLHETDPQAKLQIMKQLANSGGKSQDAIRQFFKMDDAFRLARAKTSGALGGAASTNINSPPQIGN